jgi:hypothetical protein
MTTGAEPGRMLFAGGLPGKPRRFPWSGEPGTHHPEGTRVEAPRITKRYSVFKIDNTQPTRYTAG